MRGRLAHVAAEAEQVDTQPLLWGKRQALTSWPGTECKWDSASPRHAHLWHTGAVLGRFSPETPALERGKREQGP